MMCMSNPVKIMDQNCEGTVSFATMPPEILLLILSFTDPLDIISVRKSDRYPSPYPYSWLVDPGRSGEVTASRLESLVLSISLSESRWHSARGFPHRLYTGSKQMEIVDTGHFGTILSIDTLLGRWLVVVHQEGTVALWDLLPSAQGFDHGVGFRWTERSTSVPICKYKTDLCGLGSCTSSVACMNADRNAILLAVASQNVTRLVRLNLTPGVSPMDSLATMPTPNSTYKIAALDPSSETMVFSHSSNIRCLHWPSGSFWKAFLTEDEDEELWNGVIGIKFLTPRHILCMKTRSVELYLLPDLRARAPLDTKTKTSSLRTPASEPDALGTRVLSQHPRALQPQLHS
ncbi:hypothetical protein NM688_g8672 [Phlebia brevispora]|uniref:Uncharacterized protein n=1 Tax=Phlebia brevispora TaxID=194682 RepID=A0ACC1RP22_9APHY|nr:hypothetical protein NM688_g8672 [Phlebia brevispora]